jgi:hypothetical protein
MNTKYLTVRAGSTYNYNGGTIHFVTGGFYHGSYNQNFYNNFDVAVLRVCTDFDIPIDLSKYVTCLQ